MLKTDLQVKKWNPKIGTDRASCGDSLYLRRYNDGSRVFQFRSRGQWITLGQYPSLSLAKARTIAIESKSLLREGKTTIENLKAIFRRVDDADELSTLAVTGDNVASTQSFDSAFREWYALQLKAKTWRHKASTRFPLSAYETHAEKHLGNLRIDKITRPMIKKFMQPLFMMHSETARKLLGYMHKVFEVAYDNELITGNPCPKKESFTVPKRKVQHSASLHFERLPEIWVWLKEEPYSASVKIAMQLAIVTAHRAAVIANMRWQDFDSETGIWTIPEAPVGLSEGFMKSGDSYSLKLPNELSAALCSLTRQCDYVFTVDGAKPINAETLRRNFQKFGKITTHGFRNTFKTWALNETPIIDGFLVDRYCDHALSGLDKNYRRDDLFTQRAELSERYYKYICHPQS